MSKGSTDDITRRKRIMIAEALKTVNAMDDVRQVPKDKHLSAKTLVELGAEGGTFKISYNYEGEGNKVFYLLKNESTMHDLLSEEDRKGLPPLLWDKSFSSFKDALLCLDKYPWTCFYPHYVDDDMRAELLFEVGKRTENFECWNRWFMELYQKPNY